MTVAVDTLDDALDGIKAVVVDQWGVLHDGSTPYPFALQTLLRLKERKFRLAVLSNSGKRAPPNAVRLTRMGFAPDLFDCVMTSGEMLWREFHSGRIEISRLYAVARSPGDAAAWAEGLDVSFVPVEAAQAVLLMGWPEGAAADSFDTVFAVALARKLPMLCSNPDRTAPRADGTRVVSPGALAHDYAERLGDVRFIGKPHPAVFRAVEAALGLPPEELLKVGDSLEHDIAGAHAAGWRSAFIRRGLHAESFRSGDVLETLAELARSMDTPLPDFTLDYLR